MKNIRKSLWTLPKLLVLVTCVPQSTQDSKANLERCVLLKLVLIFENQNLLLDWLGVCDSLLILSSIRFFYFSATGSFDSFF